MLLLQVFSLPPNPRGPHFETIMFAGRVLLFLFLFWLIVASHGFGHLVPTHKKTRGKVKEPRTKNSFELYCPVAPYTRPLALLGIFKRKLKPFTETEPSPSCLSGGAAEGPRARHTPSAPAPGGFERLQQARVKMRPRGFPVGLQTIQRSLTAEGIRGLLKVANTTF